MESPMKMITDPEYNDNSKGCSTNFSCNIAGNFKFCPFSEAAIRGFVYVREAMNSVVFGLILN
jgi:hypothetical protein